MLRQMIHFSRNLPQQFDQPLPLMMTRLTPLESLNQPSSECTKGKSAPLSPKLAAIENLPPDQIRALADAVAVWHLGSPLGICLRRSLLRYYFLRRVGLPVQIVFGARLKSDQEGGGIGGHAWLTLNGDSYYEHPQDYTDFVPMYIYPETIESSTLEYKQD